MSTVSEIMEIVKQQTGVDTNYDDKILYGINWAQQQIEAVKFNFLLVTIETLSLYSGTTKYALPSDFGTLSAIYVIDSTGVRQQLVEGTLDDIVLYPQSSTGVPRYYCVAETIGTTQAICIGCPTTGVGNTATYSYYKRLMTVTDADESIVSTYYKDAPLVSGALFKVWQGLERPQFADAAYNEFLNDMRIMCSEMPHTGTTYDEIMQKQILMPQGKTNEEP